MSTLSLDFEQREQAHDLLDKIESGEVTRPNDFLDEWRACPSQDELTEMYGRGFFDGPYESTEEWVSLSDVVGAHTRPVDTFKRLRLRSALRLLLEGRFQPKYSPPPHYLAINGELFVGHDGNHRTMACKAVGVEEIYATVSIIKVGESVKTGPDSEHGQQRSISQRISRWITRFSSLHS